MTVTENNDSSAVGHLPSVYDIIKDKVTEKWVYRLTSSSIHMKNPIGKGSINLDLSNLRLSHKLDELRVGDVRLDHLILSDKEMIEGSMLVNLFGKIHHVQGDEVKDILTYIFNNVKYEFRISMTGRSTEDEQSEMVINGRILKNTLYHYFDTFRSDQVSEKYKQTLIDSVWTILETMYYLKSKAIFD